MIRILIADDHPIVRSGIRNELARHSDFEVVGEALNGDDALRLAQTSQVDVLLLDVNMPGMKAIHVLQKLKSETSVKVLVLSAYGDVGTILGMIKAGADGYLLKDEDPFVIPNALREIAAGKQWLSKLVQDRLAGVKFNQNKQRMGEALTPREAEVLHYISYGYTNKEIARALQMTERTVEFHAGNLLAKLGVKNRSEAAAWAKEHPYV